MVTIPNLSLVLACLTSVIWPAVNLGTVTVNVQIQSHLTSIWSKQLQNKTSMNRWLNVIFGLKIWIHCTHVAQIRLIWENHKVSLWLRLKSNKNKPRRHCFTIILSIMHKHSWYLYHIYLILYVLVTNKCDLVGEGEAKWVLKEQLYFSLPFAILLMVCWISYGIYKYVSSQLFVLNAKVTVGGRFQSIVRCGLQWNVPWDSNMKTVKGTKCGFQLFFKQCTFRSCAYAVNVLNPPVAIGLSLQLKFSSFYEIWQFSWNPYFKSCS